MNCKEKMKRGRRKRRNRGGEDNAVPRMTETKSDKVECRTESANKSITATRANDKTDSARGQNDSELSSSRVNELDERDNKRPLTEVEPRNGREEKRRCMILITNEVKVSSSEAKWLFCQRDGCGFWTRKPERMDRHLLFHVTGSNKYKCPDCRQNFHSLPKALKHDRLSHTGVKDYECRLCDLEVTDINVHMKVG